MDQKITLSNVENSQALEMLKLKIDTLRENETLLIEDEINREPILEQLRTEYFRTLRWHGHHQNHSLWVAQVRKMSEDNCCGGCCGSDD